MPSVLDHIIQQAKDSPAVQRAELVLPDGWEFYVQVDGGFPLLPEHLFVHLESEER